MRDIRRTEARWHPDFDWLAYPVLNDETRLAMVADAKTGRLVAQGYELGSQATQILHLPAD